MDTTYRILTDSSCDLPAQLAGELGIAIVPLCVELEGREYENHLTGSPQCQLDMVDFYNTLRRGADTRTNAANPEKWSSAMEKLLAQGQDVLTLAFSSGLSSTYAAAVLAAEELVQKYPQRKIRVVDTLSASMGQGLLVYLAAERQREGMRLDQTADWVEANKLHLCHWFTVDDLMFLKRGGRVSAATAAVGTMLKIKPVLHVDDAGHLINVSKARGRRASIDAMVEKLKETAIDPGNQVIFISHGDCLDDARYLADCVRAACHPRDVVISYVGPVIGAHSGPGTLALFFLGAQR